MGRVDDHDREEYETQRAAEEWHDRPHVARQEYANLIRQIREEYVAMNVARSPVLTVTEVAQGEGGYVQKLIEKYGFKVTVIALKLVSKKAQQLFEKYGATWKRK